ncbi:MAG: hypothetical protein ABIT01_13355, partial [Thermoanaerobaculia bacterium]
RCGGDAMRQEQETGANEGCGAAAGEPRLLLIEDSAFVRRNFVRTFQALGFGVATAITPSEGIKMVALQSFDLVILEGSLSESQQDEIEGSFCARRSQRAPIILQDAPPTAGGACRSRNAPRLAIHGRKPMTPLVEQIRELLARPAA